MLAVVQRVKKSSVKIDNKLYSSINEGLNVLLCVEKGDDITDVDWIVKKIVNARIFEDENGKMSKSCMDINGEILLVSQFTICGNMRKGNRPSFDKSMEPVKANELFLKVHEKIQQSGINVVTGKFQEYMDVEILNSGPVTIILDSKKRLY